MAVPDGIMGGEGAVSALSSRERVLRAVRREETDRLPVDLWVTGSSERRLMVHLGCATGEDLRQRLGIDLRTVFPRYVGPTLTASPTYEEDIWGVGRSPVRTARASYMEVSRYPLADARTIDDLDRYAWPSPDWLDYQELSRRLRRDAGEHAVVICDARTNRTTILHQAIYLIGMERVMMELAVGEEFMGELFRRISTVYLGINERIFEATRGQVDFLLIGDDLGTQNGLLISPEMIRRFILPHLARYAEQCHAYDVKVLFHSCGSVREIIPELIEAGVDVLNPIQVRASGMEPAELKQEFGDRLSFHGGVDVQEILPNGTPEDVHREVRRLAQTLGAGGGYILCTTHNIQDDVPVENALAVYRAAGSMRQ